MSKDYSAEDQEKELQVLIRKYEEAKSKGESIYLDASDFADIANYYIQTYMYSEAAELLDLALAIHTDNTELLLEKALLHMEYSQIDEAREVLYSIKDEDNIGVIVEKAQLELMESTDEQSTNKAMEILSNIDDESRDLPLLIEIYNIFFSQRLYKQAKYWLDIITKKFPNTEDTAHAEYLYYSNTKEREKSIQSLDKLINHDPYNESYWIALSREHSMNQQDDKALDAIEYALAINPESGIANLMKGNYQATLEDYDGALKSIHQAYVYGELSEGKYCLFTAIFSHMNSDFSKAEEFFNRAERLLPNDEDSSILIKEYYRQRIIMTFLLSRFDDVDNLCCEALTSYPDEAFFWLYRGKVFLHLNREEEAEEMFIRCIELDGTNIELYKFISSEYEECGMYEKAKEYLKRAFKLGNYDDYIVRAIVYNSIYTLDTEDFFTFNKLSKKPLVSKDIEKLIDLDENITPEIREMLKELLQTIDEE